MELLGKMILSLPQSQYDRLLEKIGGNKNTNNYITIEGIRKGFSFDEINSSLGISKGAFTTHKSRLLKKVTEQLTLLDSNPISLLKEETSRVSYVALQSDRELALKILFDLETRLKRYDLPGELSTVYKLLARLHRFYPEFEEYEMLYKKHIAFALAITKAEDLLYSFIYNLSHYYLTEEESYKNEIEAQLYELENFSSLYSSHRLFVLHTIAKIYYDCSFLEKEKLQLLELEVEENLKKIHTILTTYTNDELYQNIAQLVPFLFFEYYANINNIVKSGYYLEQVIAAIPKVSSKQLWPFFLTQAINSIVSELIYNKQHEALVLNTHHKLQLHYQPDANEIPHYISWQRFRAIIYYLDNDYKKATKTIIDMRNTISLKNYIAIEAEMKLFLAFLYAIQSDEELSKRFLSSIKRLVKDTKGLKPIVKVFGKIVTLILKHKKSGKEKEKIYSYWEKFNTINTNKLLFFIDVEALKL